jgi:hypothetical protein
MSFDAFALGNVTYWSVPNEEMGDVPRSRRFLTACFFVSISIVALAQEKARSAADEFLVRPSKGGIPNSPILPSGPHLVSGDILYVYQENDCSLVLGKSLKS